MVPELLAVCDGLLLSAGLGLLLTPAALCLFWSQAEDGVLLVLGLGAGGALGGGVLLAVLLLLLLLVSRSSQLTSIFWALLFLADSLQAYAAMLVHKFNLWFGANC